MRQVQATDYLTLYEIRTINRAQHNVA